MDALANVGYDSIADSPASYAAREVRASPDGNVALTKLLRLVADANYRFVTPTPLTHQHVLERRGSSFGTTLRDIFGWNLQFVEAAQAQEVVDAMHEAGILLYDSRLARSGVRIATLNDDQFLHSSYPTSQADAVFFGPDTYRFARFIINALDNPPGTALSTPSGPCSSPVRVLDIGCGSGAGGIVAARWLAGVDRPVVVTMNDINPLALRYALINSQFAGIPAELLMGDAHRVVTGKYDLIVANPPYLDDGRRRTYRHGGERSGRALSVSLAALALEHLAPGGLLLLYTGVAIFDGIDNLRGELQGLLDASEFTSSYTEIDPDVFGEELLRDAYANADRIAAVGWVVQRNGRSHCSGHHARSD
jgi:methylase of polypeptide subunit release factors